MEEVDHADQILDWSPVGRWTRTDREFGTEHRDV